MEKLLCHINAIRRSPGPQRIFNKFAIEYSGIEYVIQTPKKGRAEQAGKLAMRYHSQVLAARQARI